MSVGAFHGVLGLLINSRIQMLHAKALGPPATVTRFAAAYLARLPAPLS
jgi:hypothetical protein